MLITLQFRYLLTILWLCHSFSSRGQENYMDDVMGVVFLDSVTVVATKKGFNVKDFINLVREDTSFYMAFKNLRRARYTSQNDIKLYGKKHEVISSYSAQTRQVAWKNCRSMEVIEEKTKGRYLDRRGNHRYLTAALFHYLFWTEDTVCSKFFSPIDSIYSSTMERYKAQLKTTVFSPGKPVKGVPLVGKKMAIFSKENNWVYDYAIRSELFNEQDCYVFSVGTTDSLDLSERDAVISEMVTYFNKKDFRIVARRMHLSFASLLFDFNVRMEIDIQPIREHNIVERVSYNGYWDIPFRKPEIATFEVTFEVEDIVEE